MDHDPVPTSMTPQLPSFLRRRLRLSDARRALLGGEPEEALAHLDDHSLALSDDATRLRERVLDVLCRQGAQLDREGNRLEADRLLCLVERYDEQRAGLWRRRLGTDLEGDDDSALDAGPPSGLTPAAESGIIGALEQLLDHMRDERTRSGVRRHAVSPGGDDRERGSGDEQGRSETEGARGDARFHLAVDDVGEFLVLTTEKIIIGHARGEGADLPILADLDPRHVRLYRAESFHSGPTWRIEPVSNQRIAIGGQLVDPGGAVLSDGDEVQVATNLAFRFRRPQAASGSAILELLHGAECAGARRVLLFASGEAGRVQMSASRGRHLRIPRLTEEVTLWVDGEEIVVESKARLTAPGADAAIQQGGERGPGGLRIPLPPTRRIDFSVGKTTASGPPFGFSVRPIDRGA
jgi:hypothetical protein